MNMAIHALDLDCDIIEALTLFSYLCWRQDIYAVC